MEERKAQTHLESFLDHILGQIDPSTILDNDIREVLIEFTEDYVEILLDKVCELAKHRGSKKVTKADINYVLAHYFSS